DGGDLLMSDGAHRQRARAHRRTVDVHRASTALGNPAAIFRAHQTERIPQHPEQGRVGIDIDVVGSPVDGKTRHPLPLDRTSKRRFDLPGTWFEKNMPQKTLPTKSKPPVRTLTLRPVLH